MGGPAGQRANTPVAQTDPLPILELDESGAYIRPCTRNVFLKYYTAAEDQQLSIWGPLDQEPYYEKLLAAASPFVIQDAATGVEAAG